MQSNNYKEIFSLKNRIAIVTGGSGHLGSEISRALAEYGAKVYMVSRNSHKFKRGIKIFKLSNNISLYNCDVTVESDFRGLVDLIIDKHGRIDILVNNAITKQNEPFEKLTKALWNKALDGALTHYFTCTQAVCREMLKRKYGVIINIASLYSFLGTDQRIFKSLGANSPVHYSVAKGGILQMTRYFATLWAKNGIRVNAISPGHMPPENLLGGNYKKELLKRIPAGRIGNPRDIIGTVLLLASDSSSYTTGQNFVVDGGWSVW